MIQDNYQLNYCTLYKMTYKSPPSASIKKNKIFSLLIKIISRLSLLYSMWTNIKIVQIAFNANQKLFIFVVHDVV
jgi:hypothetical protein